MSTKGGEGKTKGVGCKVSSSREEGKEGWGGGFLVWKKDKKGSVVSSS
jgi:hypothetical protein